MTRWRGVVSVSLSIIDLQKIATEVRRTIIDAVKSVNRAVVSLSPEQLSQIREAMYKAVDDAISYLREQLVNCIQQLDSELRSFMTNVESAVSSILDSIANARVVVYYELISFPPAGAALAVPLKTISMGVEWPPIVVVLVEPVAGESGSAGGS